MRQPVGDGAGLDDVAGERQAVDDGGAEPGIGEGLGPAAEALVTGDRHRIGLLSFGQHLEQQLGPTPVQLHVAELVQAQKINSALAGNGFRQLSVVGGLHRLVGQLGGEHVLDPVALLGGVGAQSDEQVAFPVPESPIKQSGSPLAIQAQVARLAITAGAMLGFAA
jgi:hypothetical protein